VLEGKERLGFQLIYRPGRPCFQVRENRKEMVESSIVIVGEKLIFTFWDGKDALFQQPVRRGKELS